MNKTLLQVAIGSRLTAYDKPRIRKAVASPLLQGAAPLRDFPWIPKDFSEPAGSKHD